MRSCWIGQGFELVGWSGAEQRFFFVNRLSRRAWLGVSFSLSDALSLRDECANIGSARCLALSTTKKGCVEQLAETKGFKTL